MFILFLVLWLIFNGRLTVEIFLLGLLFAALLSLFFYKILGYSPASDRKLLRNLPLVLLYVLNLIREIVIAAWQVSTLVWSSARKPEPMMVEFHSGLDDPFANVVLANSITLTPGTFTVEQQDDRFLIHCLRPEFAEGLQDSSFIRLLRRVRA